MSIFLAETVTIFIEDFGLQFLTQNQTFVRNQANEDQQKTFLRHDTFSLSYRDVIQTVSIVHYLIC